MGTESRWWSVSFLRPLLNVLGELCLCDVMSSDTWKEELVAGAHFSWRKELEKRVGAKKKKKKKKNKKKRERAWGGGEGRWGVCVCGVKLQQQLVYPGMLARMLTLSFTSHLLSYYLQSLVCIPSCSNALLLPTVRIHVLTCICLTPPCFFFCFFCFFLSLPLFSSHC